MSFTAKNILDNKKKANPGKNYLLRDYQALAKELRKYSLKDVNQEEFKKRNRIKVLLVEDDIVNQRFTKMILENRGFVVETASDGKSGFEKYKLAKYNLILMDIQMPVMDGLTAAQKIREYEEVQGYDNAIPIIALSAEKYTDDLSILLSAGIDYYINKPFNFETFINLLDLK